MRQPSEPPGQPPPDHVRATRRRWLVGGAVVAAGVAVAVAAWLWPTGRPLSPAEERLVGTWAIPLPPNPPPNAVQQVYELHRGGRLVRAGRPVRPAAGGPTAPMTGTWRVEDGHLVLEAVGPNPNSLADRVRGQGAKVPRTRDRFRIVEQTDGGLLLEDQPGSVLRLERVRD